MNIEEHVAMLYVGISFGYMPRSGIAGTSGSTMYIFPRNHQTDFQSGCTSLQSHQQWKIVSLSLHPCQHLLSPEFLILSILTGNQRVHIEENMSLLYVGASFGYMPRNGIAGSSGSAMSNFLRNCQTDFQSGFFLAFLTT